MINRTRLQRKIEELGKIGQDPAGGLTRTTFTPQELEARNWLIQELEAIHVDVSIDPAANIWGKSQGTQSDAPSIVCGSHIDTVPNGGKYDGALGVLIALEILTSLRERGVQTVHPLELVSFSGEEPNPFRLSTFGSRALTGKLTKEHIETVTDASGNVLTERLEAAGGRYEQFNETQREPLDFAHYLEVHIEQGKRLLNHGITVGVVRGITGIYRERITVQGQANHAGTTMMGSDRQDALTAASQLVLKLEKLTTESPIAELVATVGELHVYPNAANIVPGKVYFTMEIRGETEEQIASIRTLMETEFALIEKARNVAISRDVILDQAGVPMDEMVMKTMETVATKLGHKTLTLGSMAGHDAAHMAGITSAGMLFVPSLEAKAIAQKKKVEWTTLKVLQTFSMKRSSRWIE
ncbi:M20 family metallo-hydrolase [Geomicrobium sp. JCM 19055]|uniref:M20 family metallo-hydrolase n=1 Tax=Geomicrobium sp. JCM 19055 TaxID=1460649 RepID=UPI00045ED518|nr:M20 family metallo-hydrolase [Geomicrobium sp. JCM 19055]GAJ98054.1 N-carbamoyl-L-amino acid hydrolase [Geomicrobium sp. JCM 19055]